MPVTFKSKATGDLFMVSAHAEQVLHCIGKTAKEPGVLQVYQMDAALQALRSLPDMSAADEAALAERLDEGEDSSADASEANVPMSGGISLHKRAFPFTQMIEAAKVADADIVWGV